MLAENLGRGRHYEELNLQKTKKKNYLTFFLFKHDCDLFVSQNELKKIHCRDFDQLIGKKSWPLID